MKKLIVIGALICGTAYAAQKFDDGSVYLEAREAEYVINVVNNLTERVALQQLRIQELEMELKDAKVYGCKKTS